MTEDRKQSLWSHYIPLTHSHVGTNQTCTVSHGCSIGPVQGACLWTCCPLSVALFQLTYLFHTWRNWDSKSRVWFWHSLGRDRSRIYLRVSHPTLYILRIEYVLVLPDDSIQRGNRTILSLNHIWKFTQYQPLCGLNIINSDI